MNVENLKIFHHPPDRLRLTVKDECSYLTVKPVWAAPLSRPHQSLSLLDGKSKEITLLNDPSTLDEASWRALESELRERYLTAEVQSIIDARQEFGATYWTVETNRGRRDFVTQNLQENALWFSDTHLMLLDVDGNRFEVPDTNALDARSKSLLFSIV
jgi:hypothetical protein